MNQRGKIILGAALAGLVALAGFSLYRAYLGKRSAAVIAFIRAPEKHADWKMSALARCGDAPFSFPSEGFVGYLWGDSFKPFQKHQGIDIFAGTAVGLTPVYAPYDGYLTREEGWKSSLIIRVPDDPLHPGTQIWLYMTHLADPQGKGLISADFPPGTREAPVRRGDLLGYQGNYSGNPDSPTGVHLHFSIVRDNGSGKYLNELEFTNTLDPSPYFNLPLNGSSNKDVIPLCSDAE
ncbi:MAG TPA: M23 family metallopeptidase [Anaerolineaceae bacterium]|nr:M23 family metallopeptidase [Anaerolineaceae bacterium]HPS32563.1 M23 family metallopeptidase [Anaerolineaceae bacterium]